MPQQTMAILATFTADPLAEALCFWQEQLGLPAAVTLAPYNQVFQQLLDPAGVLARHAGGSNVVLVRFEDWLRFDGGLARWATPEGQAKLRGDVADLAAAVRRAAGQSPATFLVSVCPPSPALVADPVRAAFHGELESALAEPLGNLANVLIVPPAEMTAAYPVAEVYDPHGDELGHIPYTPTFYAALGTLLARKVHALHAPPRKVVVVDCDETLWQGVCGEVGPAGVVLDAPRRALQEFLVARQAAGMLVCLCSKNAEDDVWEVFRRRPDLPLRPEHLAAWRINWRAKSENLRELAGELGLGLDSFIFLDDNPLECAEVEAGCPAVLTLRLPRPVEGLPHFLRHVWAFDRPRATAEDARRTDSYRQNAQRERLRQESATLADFLAGLRLEVDIAEPAPDRWARVAQLTQRTNQFNVSTRRRTEAEVEQQCRSGALACRAVTVRDRFGDYGLVGVVLYRTGPEAVEVDTFLLSCRVLGRGVEHRMLRWLGDLARERGLARVEIPFLPTAKNQPARDFLEAVGAAFRETREGGFLFRFPAEAAASCAFAPASASVSVGKKAEAEAEAKAEERAPALLTRIALELDDARKIQAAVAARRRLGRPAAEPAEPPRTPIERKVAGVWAEVLGRDGLSLQDNFFELGGDSVLATQVVARLRDAFGLPLPLRSLFEAPTVAGLAMMILADLAEGSDGTAMVELLTELEG